MGAGTFQVGLAGSSWSGGLALAAMPEPFGPRSRDHSAVNPLTCKIRSVARIIRIHQTLVFSGGLTSPKRLRGSGEYPGKLCLQWAWYLFSGWKRKRPRPGNNRRSPLIDQKKAALAGGLKLFAGGDLLLVAGGQHLAERVVGWLDAAAVGFETVEERLVGIHVLHIGLRRHFHAEAVVGGIHDHAAQAGAL